MRRVSAKSALLAETVERAAGRGMRVVADRAAEHERDVPFGLVVDALDDDDVIVGGAGPDTLSGDHPGGECGIYWCKLPSGNDTIEARDGERDSVTCGAGSDTVRADPGDTVAPDCETVERGANVDPRNDRVGPGAECRVPTLRGLSARKAKAKLAKAGCKARIRRARSTRVPRGRVISQSARAGKRLERGATVTIKVSRGRR